MLKYIKFLFFGGVMVTSRLRILMAENKIRSISELYRRLDQSNLYISRQTLQRITQDEGVNKMNFDTILKLMKFFNCSLTDLFEIDWDTV